MVTKGDDRATTKRYQSDAAVVIAAAASKNAVADEATFVGGGCAYMKLHQPEDVVMTDIEDDFVLING